VIGDTPEHAYTPDEARAYNRVLEAAIHSCDRTTALRDNLVS
jgi:hypothetical protein